MADELIISVSGLRGVVGRSLTEDVAYRYAAAFAAGLSDGPVVVTRDGRANGTQLLPAVLAGLSQDGRRKVLDAGVAATPTTGVLVRHHGAAGGVQISASHNPAEYNGLKLFSAAGRVVPGDVGQHVLERFKKWPQRESVDATSGFDADPPTASTAVNRYESIVDTTSAHMEAVEQIVDVQRIRARRFRVLLDANHGAGSVLGRILLGMLDCETTVLGGEPNGKFAHRPEPTAENLAAVLADAIAPQADVMFCQDPDADRLAVIDEHGRYLGEEYTLAMCVDHVLRQTPGAVVTNCSTSRMTEDLAVKHNVPFYRSAVGEANVVDKMLATGAVFGGEGNGGVIDPRVGLVRDSFVGMALLLDALAERAVPVSQLADELPRYAIVKTKVALDRDKVPAALDALERAFRDAASDRLDGLRLDWSDSDGHGAWLLVRASNTEPIVRAIAEARTAADAQRLCDEVSRVIGSID